jgi:small subunit ribosomal protein S6
MAGVTTETGVYPSGAKPATIPGFHNSTLPQTRGPGTAGSEGRRRLAMRAYELMVIIDAELDDEAIDNTVKRIADQLGQRGATVKNQDRWGRRRFAYEINHKHEGYYVVYEFVGGSDLDQLERALRLADETIRHKVVRLPDSEATRRGLLEQAS